MKMKVQLLIGGMMLAVVCGCGAKDGQPAKQSTAAAGHDHDHDHDHPSEGPHHGTLVELGNEEFHAEVVHEKDSVTVYILDAHAEKASPVDATELTINVLHDGKPEQFKLPASAEASDGEGKSSRFTITDADLAKHMDEEASAPKLSITINGKPYRGEIHHEHDHDHKH